MQGRWAIAGYLVPGRILPVKVAFCRSDWRSLMDIKKSNRPIEILLVEDNAADAQLVERAFRTACVPVHLCTVEDGFQALDYLHRKESFPDAVRPDLIMLDLNLPGRDGHEVL